MRSLISHLRYTLRLLLKSPGFTITAVLILGFGIGLNTTIFSLINNVILKPVSFPEPSQLVELFMPFQNVEFMPLDYPDYAEIAATQRSFQGLAAYVPEDMNLNAGGEAVRISGAFVSASMFEVSGLPLILGRAFTSDEDKSGGPLVLVLGETFWRTRFRADPGIIGRSLTVNGRAFEVIGIALPQAFELRQTDVYIPIHSMRALNFQDRAQHYVECIGRLKNGFSISEARSEVASIHSRLIDQYPGEEKGYRTNVIPLLGAVKTFYSPTIWLLAAAVGCLFLISAANIVNLILGRALERRREIGIRKALGASNYRIAGQLFIESLLLSMLGAGVGLLVALLGVGMVRTLGPNDDWSRFNEVQLDGVTLLFFAGITLLSSLLFALFPAWGLTKTKGVSALNAESSRSTTMGRDRQRTQTALVIVQVAFACTLVIVAGLLMRSFQATQSVALGFNPDHLLTGRIFLSSSRYALGAGVDPAAVAINTVQINKFFETLLERAEQLPGVNAAAIGDPPFMGFLMDSFFPPGDADPGHAQVCAGQVVSSDYFRTLQIPLVQGRGFGSQDRPDMPRVVIIDEAMARRCFPNQNPVGRVIAFGGEIAGLEIAGFKRIECIVVGVVQTVQASPPDQPHPEYQAYFPYTQAAVNSLVLILRSAADPSAQITGLRKLVATIDPDVLVYRIMSMDDVMGTNFTTRRLGAYLVSLFSGAALFLSAIGLYGVLAYAVNQRKREIGVRIALGAQSTNILKLIFRHGFEIVGIGLVIGTVCSLVVSRFMQSLLYSVSSDDTVTFGVAISVLGLTGFLACLLPALRAMRTDPITVLRE